MTDLWRAFHELLSLGVLLVATTGVFFVAWWRWERSGRHRAAKRVAVAFAATWFVAAALVTLRPRPPLITASGDFVTRRIDLIPGSDLWDVLFKSVSVHVLIEQIAGNVLLFVPLGVVLWMLNPARLLRRSVVSGAIAGSLFEALQWILGTGRICSVDDVILASLGTAIGTMLVGLLLLRRRATSRPASVRRRVRG